MNLAERADDLDYEPDVMKLKQIWGDIKGKAQEQSSLSKQKPTNDRSKSKTKKIKEATKKETVVSKKNIERNPKPNHSSVIQVTTQPYGLRTDNLHNQKNLQNPETLLQTATNSYPVAQLNQLKRAISQKDHQLSLLRVSNSRNQDKVSQLQIQLEKKDEIINQLQSRQRQLLHQIGKMGDKQCIFEYGRVQYENFKSDTKRLLRMLQTTAEYQQFANLALEDDGVRFLHSVNKKVKTHIDSTKKASLHFCTCNKDFIPESGFWVPDKIYSFGREFVRERKGEITQPQFQLLLYQLNKIWRQRQKRIVNTLNGQKGREVEKLKRKIANVGAEKGKR